MAVFMLGLLGLGCEPSPKYPFVEQPVVGTVLAEMSVIASNIDQHIDMASEASTNMARLRILVPAGAYPTGTRVTARLVNALPMPIDACIVFDRLLDRYLDSYLALQILPASLAPVIPLRVDFARFYVSWGYVVLHAREGDANWRVAENLEMVSEQLGFSIPEPGLWAVGLLRFPPSLQGRLQRVEATCVSGGGVPPNMPAKMLDVAGSTFALGTARAGSDCYQVVRGTLGLECSRWERDVDNLLLRWDSGAADYITNYGLDSARTGIWWELVDSQSGCSGGHLREHFTLLPLGKNPPPLPRPTDAGTCTVDAGTMRDGGRD